MINGKIALTLLPVFWPNMPPLGLAVLKGYLAANGIQTTCLDFNNYFFQKVSSELQKEWRKSCNQGFEENIYNILSTKYSSDFSGMIDRLLDYEIVGMTCYQSNIETVLKVARLLKQKNNRIKIILGGPEIARAYFDRGEDIQTLYDNSADLLVVGEGERPIFKYVTGHKYNEHIAAYDEIDIKEEAPLPDYSDFTIDSYPRKLSVSLICSKGCVKGCRFCSERLLHKKFRVYPVSNTVKQIEYHKDKGINQFVFHDSLINGDLRSLESLCDEIINNFGSIHWEAQIAIRDDMPDRLFKKIKESGCYNLFVGLESGCDDILKKMNKGFTVGMAGDFFGKLKAHKLSFGVSIIVGFPGETEETFREGLNFILQNRDLIPKIEQVNPFVYYNGIDLPKEADYKYCKESIKRANIFIEEIKQAGFKYTKAFMMNLVEPSWK